jgi:hypothetical protein
MSLTPTPIQAKNTGKTANTKQPPWGASAPAVNDFLAGPAQVLAGDPGNRSHAQIAEANRIAFSRLRPQWAKTGVASPAYSPPRTRECIERALEASGLIQQDWHLDGLSKIREVLLVSQILDQFGQAPDRPSQLERIARARIHMRALECVFTGVKSAIDQAETELDLVEPAAE